MFRMGRFGFLFSSLVVFKNMGQSGREDPVWHRRRSESDLQHHSSARWRAGSASGPGGRQAAAAAQAGSSGAGAAIVTARRRASAAEATQRTASSAGAPGQVQRTTPPPATAATAAAQAARTAGGEQDAAEAFSEIKDFKRVVPGEELRRVAPGEEPPGAFWVGKDSKVTATKPQCTVESSAAPLRRRSASGTGVTRGSETLNRSASSKVVSDVAMRSSTGRQVTPPRTTAMNPRQSARNVTPPRAVALQQAHRERSESALGGSAGPGLAGIGTPHAQPPGMSRS